MYINFSVKFILLCFMYLKYQIQCMSSKRNRVDNNSMLYVDKIDLANLGCLR